MRTHAQLRAAVACVLTAAVAGTAGSAWAAAPLTSSSSGGRFDPVSVTFVSASTGWALGRSTCPAGTCLALRETGDGGRLWGNVALPKRLLAEAEVKGPQPVGSLLGVRFADAEDGWIYGFVPSGQRVIGLKTAIWSTHDGGASWHPVAIAGFDPALGGVLDLEAGGGRAYALLYRLTAFGGYEGPLVLESTPLGEDDWAPRPPRSGCPAAGGTSPERSSSKAPPAGWWKATTGALPAAPGSWPGAGGRGRRPATSSGAAWLTLRPQMPTTSRRSASWAGSLAPCPLPRPGEPRSDRHGCTSRATVGRLGQRSLSSVERARTMAPSLPARHRPAIS